MERNISNIKERILYFTDLENISKEYFFEDLGVTYGGFKGKAKEQALSSDVIERIITKYPKLNPDWLLTGKGEMLRDDLLTSAAVESENGYPMLTLEAFAGPGDSSIFGDELSRVTERYDIPLFKGLSVDFMISVKGSSMYPKYNSGDVVACRIINEVVFIQWNKVYVIDTESQGVMLKRLKPSNNENMVVCKSDNDNYDPFEIPKEEIRKLAMVVGVVRLE
jgi:repressor LexA